MSGASAQGVRYACVWRLGRVGKVLAGCFALLLGAGGVSADITSGLLAHWQFDEGSGTTVADQSGANRTMTVSSSAS